MATTRNGYFRELIYKAMERLTAYERNLKVLYYLDENKIPFIYVNVENEQRNQRFDVDGNGDIALLDNQNYCEFILRLFFSVKDSKSIAQDLTEKADEWIELIEKELIGIDIDDTYIQTMNGEDFYQVQINSIDITSNERADYIQNDKVMVLTINGKINYSITYL